MSIRRAVLPDLARRPDLLRREHREADENMVEIRPTIMTAVPRLYEAMHQRIQRGHRQGAPLQRRLFDLALTWAASACRGGTLGLGERLLDLVAEITVRRKVRQRFGGRLKAWVSGGAALNPEIGLFFLALGVPLLQGYGQTEASPVISANPPRRIKIATVGPALEGVEVRIAEDGEILVRAEAGDEGLLARGGPPPRRSATAGSIPAISAGSTPRAISRSPTARRTSSCCRAATMSRRPGSRAAGAAARDRPGHGPWRPPAASRGPAGAR